MTFEELVKNHSAEMIEKLLTEILGKSHVEIRFDYQDQDQWAVISVNQYEEDKEISIRLHINKQYNLVFGYYDDDDEFFEIIKPLSEAEVDSIPDKLKMVMNKVVTDEQGIRLASGLISK
jgi:plasmid maintenance system killer protein